LRSIGLRPAATAFDPSFTIACANTVAVVVPSPATSFAEKDINPTPKPKVIRGKGAVATIDSDAGHGLVVGPYAMKMAIEKAKDYGIGSVTVINGRHFGACAYHAEMALKHNMIGIAMTTGGLMVAPVNGAEAKVGLNPIGVAVPTKDEPPFIFDASMS
jgi:LDH2 family malate/lactate/ureidoglycolate dehydrogenase